ncbi:hypothetical protein NC652_020567 [Populus alba x Populus x berolinensis]|nr:hypothetical protein NC652_020567 [Populus alba x Populus x berolinensis]
MGFGLPWLGFLDLTWVLQDLGLFIFYNRWVLHDLVLNKCGCARLPAGYVGGYCSAGYWIFIPFILFHFIGLVAAVVLGFVRVPMLSRIDDFMTSKRQRLQPFHDVPVVSSPYNSTIYIYSEENLVITRFYIQLMMVHRVLLPYKQIVQSRIIVLLHR